MSFLGTRGGIIPGVSDGFFVNIKHFLRVSSQSFLQALEFFFPQFRAMNRAGVLLGRRRPTDNCAQGNDRRPMLFSFSSIYCLVKSIYVFVVFSVLSQPINPLGVPAVRFVALEHVFLERYIGIVLNRDMVIIPDHNEVTQILYPS